MVTSAHCVTLDCSSAVYNIGANSRLRLYQKLPTQGAISMTAFSAKMDGSAANATYLVIANSRDNVGNIEQDVVVYGWHNITEQFRPIQTIPTVDVQRVHAFTPAQSQLVNQSARGITILTLTAACMFIMYTWILFTYCLMSVILCIPV